MALKLEVDSGPFRTLMELSNLFADEELSKLEICRRLTYIRERMGITPVIGYLESEGPRYSLEQQRQIIDYHNNHPPAKTTYWRRFSTGVLDNTV